MRSPTYVAPRFMWRSLREARRDASLHPAGRHITWVVDAQKKVCLRREPDSDATFRPRPCRQGQRISSFEHGAAFRAWSAFQIADNMSRRVRKQETKAVLFPPSTVTQLFGPTPHHVLLEAKSIESFTETKLRTNARAFQHTPTIFETSRIEASADSNLAGSG
jgi:hypothetical protein